MERSQGFITSVYRALTGSRCKTRRRQVNGIPPTPVTTESHTPATQNKLPTRKTLAEDATLNEFGSKSQATLEEVPEEDSTPNSNLEESYVAEVQ